jgi:hypothetical protein
MTLLGEISIDEWFAQSVLGWSMFRTLNLNKGGRSNGCCARRRSSCRTGRLEAL